MKDEVLRMDRVTYLEQGETELDQLCLSVDAGEIVGLIPANDRGTTALFKLLKQNLPIHYGYIYYRGKLVNHWQRSDLRYNNIAVIGGVSSLADDLTVADNVFVLRKGFGKHIIQRHVLCAQLKPFLDEIGVNLSADAYVRELSVFSRFITELVRAVVARSQLIVLIEPETIIGAARLGELHRILRHYASKGFSFLYLCRHYEEAKQICDKAAIMFNGQITKVFSSATTTPDMLKGVGVDTFTDYVRNRERKAVCRDATPALELQAISDKSICDISLRIMPGECVVLQDLNNRMLDQLTLLLNGEKAPQHGHIWIDGKPQHARNRDIAIIQKLPTQTMLFPHMSYLDNLCFMMDHRMAGIWRRQASKKGVSRELASPMGKEDLFEMPVESLSEKQKYNLVYSRVLLQRPKVVVCMKPFMSADVESRMHIWEMMERFLDKGISVLILTVNLADTLALADRLIQIQDGKLLAAYERRDFNQLPTTTPWHILWAK